MKIKQEALQMKLINESKMAKTAAAIAKKEFAAVRLNIEDKKGVARLNSMSTVNESLLDLQTKHNSNN